MHIHSHAPPFSPTQTSETNSISFFADSPLPFFFKRNSLWQIISHSVCYTFQSASSKRAMTSTGIGVLTISQLPQSPSPSLPCIQTSGENSLSLTVFWKVEAVWPPMIQLDRKFVHESFIHRLFWLFLYNFTLSFQNLTCFPLIRFLTNPFTIFAVFLHGFFYYIFYVYHNNFLSFSLPLPDQGSFTTTYIWTSFKTAAFAVATVCSSLAILGLLPSRWASFFPPLSAGGARLVAPINEGEVFPSH